MVNEGSSAKVGQGLRHPRDPPHGKCYGDVDRYRQSGKRGGEVKHRGETSR